MCVCICVCIYMHGHAYVHVYTQTPLHNDTMHILSNIYTPPSSLRTHYPSSPLPHPFLIPSSPTQLAVLLRTALTMKSKDSYREVYCWQTINCLELWAKVLASNADQQPLRPLVYPVIQLLLGTARLVPTPTYLPLRVRCIRAVNRLAAAMQVYVPVGALCVEVLTWSQLGKPARGGGSGRECPDLLLQLRVSKGNLESTALQQEVVSQVCCGGILLVCYWLKRAWCVECVLVACEQGGCWLVWRACVCVCISPIVVVCCHAHTYFERHAHAYHPQHTHTTPTPLPHPPTPHTTTTTYPPTPLDRCLNSLLNTLPNGHATSPFRNYPTPSSCSYVALSNVPLWTSLNSKCGGWQMRLSVMQLGWQGGVAMWILHPRMCRG